MTQNLLDQLADVEIPPPPDNFDRNVHERLNGRLLLMHTFEFATSVFLYAIITFAQALFAAATFSLSGQYEDRSQSYDE